jgi:hypothetical protein
MSSFTIPTDNLYKFMAVSGLAFIVAGIVVPSSFFRATRMESVAVLRGSKELEVQEKFTNQRLGTLKLREQEAIDRKNRLHQRLEGMNSASNSTEVDKLEGQIKEANREIESIADSSHELSLNLALKRAQLNSEEMVSIDQRRDSWLFLGVGAIGVLLGIVVSSLGFGLWFKRLQQFQDREAADKAEAVLAVNAMNEQNVPTQPNQPTQVNVTEPAK